jgi:hypothetical protein
MPRKTYDLDVGDSKQLNNLLKTIYKNFNDDRKKAIDIYNALVEDIDEKNDFAVALPAQYLRIAVDCNMKLINLAKMVSAMNSNPDGTLPKEGYDLGNMTNDDKKSVIDFIDEKTKREKNKEGEKQ